MSEQFPHLALHTIAYLDSGHEYDAFVIDGNLLVRFPRYAEVAHGLERAEMVLEFVGSAVGSALVVPKIILRGTPALTFLTGSSHTRSSRGSAETMQARPAQRHWPLNWGKR